MACAMQCRVMSIARLSYRNLVYPCVIDNAKAVPHQDLQVHPLPQRHFSISAVRLSKKNNKLSERVNDWLREAKEKYDDVLERYAPFVKKYFDYLADGLRHEWRNVKSYWRIWQKRNDNPNYRKSYKEEMIVYNVHRNAIKLAPLLPVFMMPFGFFLIFVPIYVFPRYVLPQTFWTARQRRQILTAIHNDRIKEYGIILHHMNYHKNNSDDSQLRKVLQNICDTIGNGQVPANNSILPLRRFCRQVESPFNGNHMVYLLLRAFCSTIMVSPYQPHSWIRHRLASNAQLVITLDRLLLREKILSKLSPEELIYASLMRGLNSAQLSREAQSYWLENWISLTSNCDDGDVWFVLHAMVLMSVNYSEVKFQRKVFN